MEFCGSGAVTLRRPDNQSRSSKMNMNISKAAAMALMIFTLGACASTRTQQAPGEAVDDAVITSKLKAALVADPVTSAWQINVKTFRGTVQLSGFVNTADSRHRAGEIAADTRGVSGVVNTIEVKAESSSAGNVIDDSILTAKVKTALIENPITKAHQIKVDTQQGVVQLSGFVDSEAARTEASRVATSITGVRDVHNDLLVKTG
jgi:hyperosmotically inducible protein